MEKLLVILLCLGLVGCATGYNKKGLAGGYKDVKIQDDVFKVSFNGNAYTSKTKAEDFTLLRCADLALENNYKYFIIIDEKSDIVTSGYTTPARANTSGSVQMYGNQGSYSGTTTVSGGQTFTYRKPSTSNTIKCFKEKPEGIGGMVYDAEQVAKNIKESYKIKDKKE